MMYTIYFNNKNQYIKFVDKIKYTVMLFNFLLHPKRSPILPQLDKETSHITFTDNGIWLTF